MHRRTFMRMAGLSTLGAALPAVAKSPAPDLTFVVITDLHYRDARCGDWFAKVLASLKSLHPRPEFLMLAGDLSEDGTPEQLGAIKEIFAASPIPVRQLIGNHDYSLAGSRDAYESLYGKDLNRRFSVHGVQFLALDTTQQRSVYRTKIPRETIDWVKTQVPTLKKEHPLVVLTHFPLGKNWLRPRNAAELLQPLRDHHLIAGLSGHWHGLTDFDDQGVHLSTGRCCSWWRNNHDGSPEKGYIVCQVHGETVARRFVAV